MITNTKDKLWIKSMEWCKKYCSCHQMPERSFFFNGYQFPLCARCTGIALGHLFAFVVAPFYTFHKRVAILMAPLAIDGTIQYFTKYESNNKRRIISGILYGFSFTSTILCFIKSAIKKMK